MTQSYLYDIDHYTWNDNFYIKLSHFRENE